MKNSGDSQRHFSPSSTATSVIAGGAAHGWRTFCLFLTSLLSGGLLSLYCGLDANYDLKKYHIHNAWAFLNNRLETDFFPAGLQTYYHPILDISYYLLAIEWLPEHPRWVAFLMGLPTGLLLFLTVVCIYQILKTLPNLRENECLFYTGILSFFGLSGTSLVIQIGSATNEVQVACFVLGALAAFLLLRKRPLMAALASGFLLGAGTGFKLTAVIYTLPFLLALLFFSPKWRERARVFFGFCSMWWVAFLLIYGWWGWTLYQLTGNPLFPMYNNIFHSDWLPALALPGSWFVPTNVKEALFFPFTWVDSRAISAAAGTDLRFAFAYLCAAGTVVFWVTKKITGYAGTKYFFPSKVSKIILIFTLISFVIWEGLFSVLRYTIPIEVLLGVVIFICGWCILDALNIRENKLRNLLLTSLLGTFLILALGTTKYPGWGRLKNYGNTVFDVPVPQLQENTLVFLLSPETQYLVPFIAKKNPTATFISPGDEPLFLLEAMKDSGLHQRIQARIDKHVGPVCVVVHSGYTQFMKYLPAFSLSTADSLEESIATNYDSFRFYFARHKAVSSEKNSEAKKFFIEKTMTHFSQHLEPQQDAPFFSGWESSRGREIPFRWAIGNKSTLHFYLKSAEGLTGTLFLRGSQPAGHRAIVKLNGGQIFAGNFTGKENGKISVPTSLLHDAEHGGANVLEFEWPDARSETDRPWPLVRSRPGKENRPAFAFKFEALEIK